MCCQHWTYNCFPCPSSELPCSDISFSTETSHCAPDEHVFFQYFNYKRLNWDTEPKLKGTIHLVMQCDSAKWKGRNGLILWKANQSENLTDMIILQQFSAGCLTVKKKSWFGKLGHPFIKSKGPVVWISLFSMAFSWKENQGHEATHHAKWLTNH